MTTSRNSLRSSTAQIQQVADRVRAEVQRRRWLADPSLWITERLGEFLWSRQRQILESVRDNRRTAVHSAHEVGKSFVAARAAAWWIDTHPPGEAFVVTSAPTFPQVRAILWREITRAHARGRLPGRVNQTEWFMPVPSGAEELVGFGRKPSDVDPTAFQGIHARYVLVLFDEACGIPKALWDAADSLIANDTSSFLAIGNPDDPATEFGEVCKPGSGWNVIGISAFDSPNFTGEDVPESVKPLLIGRTWAEEKARKWGESNPLYIAKVLGQFPETADGGLIPPRLIADAQARWGSMESSGPVELGVDVGAGGDSTVICLRDGPNARIVAANKNPDTMQTTGLVIDTIRRHGAERAKVDPIGVGRGVVDRAKELRAPAYGVNVGAQAFDREAFANLRAELYWALRERFFDGDIAIPPDDDELASELVSLRFERTSRGQIRIEAKEDMQKRGLHSPDRADALVLAFADSVKLRLKRTSPLGQMHFI